MPERDSSEVLCLSKSGYYPGWMKKTALVTGLLLTSAGLWRLFGPSAGGFGRIYPYVFVGLGLVYFSGTTKRIYLSEEGVIRETGSFLSKGKQVLPWNRVVHVTLVTRKKQFMAFFEKAGEIKGLKVLFDIDQEPQVRAILKNSCPRTKINTITQ
jgi:hypothetical protein